MICVASLERARGAIEGRVSGTDREIDDAARLFSGHPLGLRAAGLYMASHRIAARDVSRLVGDVAIFAESDEGERLIKLVDASRAELDDDQLYFLQMLSIPSRPVTQKDFKVLIKEPVTTPHQLAAVRRRIVDPLIARELIDIEDTGAEEAYSAHPLMKLAFSRWFSGDAEAVANRRRARLAVGSPGDVSSADVEDPTRCEQILFAIERNVAAGDYDTAWEIYEGRSIHDALHKRGALMRQLEVTEVFEQAISHALRPSCSWGIRTGRPKSSASRSSG